MVSIISELQKNLQKTLLEDYYDLAFYNIQKIDNKEFTAEELLVVCKEYHASQFNLSLQQLLEKHFNYKLSNNLLKIIDVDSNKVDKIYIQEIVQIILFRLCHYESRKTKDIADKKKRNLIKKYLNFLVGLLRQKFYYIDDFDIQQYVTDKYLIHIIGSFMLNYSRSLTDENSEYPCEFTTDLDKFIKNINANITFFVKNVGQVISQLKQNELIFVKTAIELTQEIMKTNLFEDSFTSFLKDVNLTSEVNPLKYFETLRVTIVDEDIGVLGMVDGNDGIVISVNHMSSKNETYKITRLIIQILHEFGHYLIRSTSNTLITHTPRRNNNSPCQRYEAGYLLEYYLFSYETKSIEKLYWSVKDVQNYILDIENWKLKKEEFSKNITNILTKYKVKDRQSNFNDSGLEIDLERAVKE